MLTYPSFAGRCQARAALDHGIFPGIFEEH
jgi:hypothetical protein